VHCTNACLRLGWLFVVWAGAQRILCFAAEQVTFRTRLHPILFAAPIALALLALLFWRSASGLGTACLLVALTLGSCDTSISSPRSSR